MTCSFCYKHIEIIQAINEYIFHRKASRGIIHGVLELFLEKFRQNTGLLQQPKRKNGQESGKHEFQRMNEFLGSED